MRLGALLPAPGETSSFEYKALRAMPDAAGCYVLSNASEDILYIGQAISLRQRLLQHWDNGRHNIVTPYGRISRVSVLLINDIGKLNAHERGWLNQCTLSDGALPPINKIDAPV